MTSLLSTRAPSFCNGNRLSRIDSPPVSDGTMLRKLKYSFSRKEKSTPRTPSIKSQPSHPQQNTTPSTRRPTSTMSNSRSTNEAPPPYTPAENAAPAIQAGSTTSVSDDPYAFLRSFDTILLIDDSGSMAGSRWKETEQAIKTITPICTSHDADGIDILFLNSPDRPGNHNVKSSREVESIFSFVRPGGGTPTGQRLNQFIKPYLRRYEANPETTKPINIICITDGAPSDDVESPLIWAAKKLDKLEAPAWQIGVQFFQVGRDEEAKKSLKQLDDELADIAGDDDLRDIVDTVPFKGEEGATLTGEGILKVVLGAVNRRLDRKKSKDLHR